MTRQSEDVMAAALSKAFPHLAGAAESQGLARHRAAAVILAAMSDYVVVSRLAYDLLVKAASVALESTGEHRLIEGYCPDCGGGCLLGFLGFGAEPVRFVGPSPFGEPR